MPNDQVSLASNHQRLARKIIIIVLWLASVSVPPLFAVEAGQAAYVSGTSLTVERGTLGSLNIASPTTLVFRAGGGAPAAEIDIPYKSISNFQYSTEVARHLGVLPAVAVGLVRRREQKHFLSINYVDASNTPQAAVFEVPKHDPRGLLIVLRTRAPQACGKVVNNCGGFVP